MLQNIIGYLVFIDGKVNIIVLAYLQQYSLESVQKDFVFTIPIFIKLTLYLLILLVPVLIVKFLYPFMKSINFIITFFLFLITLSVFGIFIGFFQMLYS